MHFICNDIWITYLVAEEPSKVGDSSESYAHRYGES